jgi:hypothetical protein
MVIAQRYVHHTWLHTVSCFYDPLCICRYRVTCDVCIQIEDTEHPLSNKLIKLFYHSTHLYYRSLAYVNKSRGSGLGR